MAIVMPKRVHFNFASKIGVFSDWEIVDCILNIGNTLDGVRYEDLM